MEDMEVPIASVQLPTPRSFSSLLVPTSRSSPGKHPSLPPALPPYLPPSLATLPISSPPFPPSPSLPCCVDANDSVSRHIPHSIPCPPTPTPCLPPSLEASSSEFPPPLPSSSLQELAILFLLRSALSHPPTYPAPLPRERPKDVFIILQSTSS